MPQADAGEGFPFSDEAFTERLFRYQLCPRGIADAADYTRYCLYGPWLRQRDHQALSPVPNPNPPTSEPTCTRDGFDRWMKELDRIFTPPI